MHEAEARGLVARISWSSYQRTLAAVGLRPHRIQGWVHSPGSRVSRGAGHLNIVVDDSEPVGAGLYGLSFHSHTGRWEPMPITTDLTRLVQDLVGTLAPISHGGTFPTRKSGASGRLGAGHVGAEPRVEKRTVGP